MEQPKDLVMQVEGMTCQGCVRAVTRALQRLDPNAAVDVNLESGRVRVSTTATPEAVAQALDIAGYEARAVAA